MWATMAGCHPRFPQKKKKNICRIYDEMFAQEKQRKSDKHKTKYLIKDDTQEAE